MADISFDGINIDAETVRRKLEEHDAVVKVLGRSLDTSNCAELHVVSRHASDEVRLSFDASGTGEWTWDVESLDELAAFVTQLAADIRKHGIH